MGGMSILFFLALIIIMKTKEIFIEKLFRKSKILNCKIYYFRT